MDDWASDLWVAWQPIYAFESGAVWAHEALIRGPKGSPYENPEALFQLAARTGRSAELESICRSMAFSRAVEILSPTDTVFLNVDSRYPNMPINPAEAPWPPEQTVIEVSERFPLSDAPVLAAYIALWRNAGYRVALDDFGAGYAGLSTLATIRPDVVKIDRNLIHGIVRDRWYREMISAVLTVFDHLGIVAIAEGIETEDELATLRALGVSHGQGFTLGRPSAQPMYARRFDPAWAQRGP